MTKRVFLTHTTDIDTVREYNLSVAGHNFCNNLINGGLFDEIYGILPSPIREDVNYLNIKYITSTLRKGKFYKFAQLIEQIKLFKLLKGNITLWLYNVTIQNALLILLLKVFKRNIKIYPIVLDFTPSTKCLSIQSLYLKLINEANGRICLSISKLFIKNNTEIIPGIVPSTNGTHAKILMPKNRFLLSGVLYENISMISTILEVFSQLPYCELHITGFYPNETKIRTYTSTYKNIIYHGNVQYSEYLKILNYSTYVLSTRDPKYPENQCNFPSKIIESLLYNRAIISTIEYPQLKNLKYHLVSSTIDQMKDDIIHIVSMGTSEQMQYLNQENAIKKICSICRWENAMAQIECTK